tara:strand:- start:8153 stop:9607 length:1455 start_codon:yes stop_codon:yes gene_type:complete
MADTPRSSRFKSFGRGTLENESAENIASVLEENLGRIERLQKGGSPSANEFIFGAVNDLEELKEARYPGYEEIEERFNQAVRNLSESEVREVQDIAEIENARMRTETNPTARIDREETAREFQHFLDEYATPLRGPLPPDASGETALTRRLKDLREQRRETYDEVVRIRSEIREGSSYPYLLEDLEDAEGNHNRVRAEFRTYDRGGETARVFEEQRRERAAKASPRAPTPEMRADTPDSPNLPKTREGRERKIREFNRQIRRLESSAHPSKGEMLRTLQAERNLLIQTIAEDFPDTPTLTAEQLQQQQRIDEKAGQLRRELYEQERRLSDLNPESSSGRDATRRVKAARAALKALGRIAAVATGVGTVMEGAAYAQDVIEEGPVQGTRQYVGESVAFPGAVASGVESLTERETAGEQMGLGTSGMTKAMRLGGDVAGAVGRGMGAVGRAIAGSGEEEEPIRGSAAEMRRQAAARAMERERARKE